MRRPCFLPTPWRDETDANIGRFASASQIAWGLVEITGSFLGHRSYVAVARTYPMGARSESVAGFQFSSNGSHPHLVFVRGPPVNHLFDILPMTTHGLSGSRWGPMALVSYSLKPL